MNRTAVVTFLLVGLSVGGAARAAVPVVPVLAVSDLRPGQAAVVRTVFEGDSIESFDAVLVGVLPGGRADGDVILARATSPRVVQSGIAQGMSGSPVYVEGRLIGALSSGWSFSKEPIFGITPIGDMLAVLDRPESANPDGTSGPVGVDPQAPSPMWRDFAWGDDSRPAAPDAASPRPMRPGELPLPLAAGGLDPAALPRVREMFAADGFTVTPGGRATGKPAARPLEPGSAVAVDLLRGDLNLSAIGTVTYVDGDRVLIFGHPFFQSGEVRLPLSTASIVGILPSLATSFKLGVPGTPVGVATQDRRAAVAGRLGRPPALMPFRVEVNGSGGRQSFAFECIEDRALLPQLVAAASLNSLLESGGDGAQQSLRWRLTAWRAGRVLRLGDVVAGDSPTSDAINAIAGPLRFLAANPFERCHFDSLRVSLEVSQGRDQWTLRSARALAARVRPGGKLRVSLDLEHWRGAHRNLEIEVPVPEEFPAGRYTLWLGGGAEFDRAMAAKLPWRFRPVSLADAWDRLGSFHSSDAVYSAFWARAPEVSSGGEDYPELPGSALAVLASPESAGDGARRADWAVFPGPRTPVRGVLRGDLSLDVVVDRSAP